MQIICLQENLKQALNITERIIGRNLTLPILNNLLLNTENNRLKISSTNLEIGIISWINGKIEKQGEITVPAKLLSNFVNNLPNKKIEIKVKGSQLYLKCENFRAMLNGLDAKEFPIIPKIKDKPLVRIKGGILKTNLSQVAEMASLSDSRPEISGVLMNFEKNTIKLAATDSFRLAEKIISRDQKEPINQSMIIPQRTIQELIRILGEKEAVGGNQEQEVEIILGGNQILFDLGDVQIISRLIEGQYPDYQQIIPKNFTTQATLVRTELINNIRVASLFSGKANNVRFFIRPKPALIEIFSKDTDVGENRSQIEAKIEGKELEIVFNCRYVLDGLNNIMSDKIVLGLNNNSSPAIIKPVGDASYTYLVMPIKA